MCSLGISPQWILNTGGGREEIFLKMRIMGCGAGLGTGYDGDWSE